MPIDPMSYLTTPVIMNFDTTELSLGTGFFWNISGQDYLLTNWHNLTGKNPLTGNHLSPTAAEPNNIVVFPFTDDSYSARVPVQIEIFTADGVPLWLEHPALAEQADVVALPLRLTPPLTMQSTNSYAPAPLVTSIGREVFILGYPFGIGEYYLPVWKKGSIASEPDLAGHESNYMLIDTASRPGMSGAPVFQRSFVGFDDAEGRIAAVPANRVAAKFLGIYSGRLTAQDPLDAQLGMVWPKSIIDEIFGSNTDSNS
ncbi:serine protease [uncultured Roseibium sp.]|uniref:S1 family peptidase n=1 Tax=uncultured Roseibium sp. TaxID=1936171 RepID=UPI002616680C|nr:serine protease [uncultured Roseibium sp.]